VATEGNMRALRGAEALDRRAGVIDPDFDWHRYDKAGELSKVVSASGYVAAVLHELYPAAETVDERGRWPWEKAEKAGLRFRPRELTVWAGINGERKSLTTSQVVLGLMRHGERVLVSSFEMRPEQTLARMARQAAGTDEPSAAYVRRLDAWYAERLWLYDHFGNCEPRKAVAVARYAASELHCKHIIIDSLMKCVPAYDDYTGQKIFVGNLCALALEQGCHVHLVAHMRKGDKESDRVGKFDIRGASEIADQADNIVLIQRNKRKEAAGEKANVDDPDMWLTVAKQRNGAFEGVLGLYWNSRSLALVEKPGGSWPAIYLPGLAGADAARLPEELSEL
jgi:twinkle protein